jgi:DNA-binding IclR family transcriptional regulator
VIPDERSKGGEHDSVEREEVPLVGGGVPLAGGGTPLAGGGTPLAGGGAPLAGGGAPLAGGGVPLAGGEVPLVGEGVPLAGGKAPPIGADMQRAGAPSLRYGLQILGLFSSERRWLRIGEIASELGLSPLEAHVYVSAMRRMRLVREGPGRRYGLGSGPPDLGMAAIRAAGIARRARQHLIALRQRTGSPVTLAMLDGTELLVVDRNTGGDRTTLEMTIDLDRRLPAHATALGKVLLAYLPEHREHACVEAVVPQALTRRTITDKRELLKHLQQVRDRGFAVEDREYTSHRRCMAAPVRGSNRRVVAAVGIAIADEQRGLEELVDRHSAALLHAAQRLSGALQHTRVDWPEP